MNLNDTVKDLNTLGSIGCVTPEYLEAVLDHFAGAVIDQFVEKEEYDACSKFLSAHKAALKKVKQENELKKQIT